MYFYLASPAAAHALWLHGSGGPADELIWLGLPVIGIIVVWLLVRRGR